MAHCNELHLLEPVSLLYVSGMRTFRIAAGNLAVIPIALRGYVILFSPVAFGPNSLGELAFLLFGVPILVLNLWAWMGARDH